MAKMNYKNCIKAMRDLQPFIGNSLWGYRDNIDGLFVVVSYHTKMAEIDLETGLPVFINEQKYSVTTSKHQNYIRQAYSL